MFIKTKIIKTQDLLKRKRSKTIAIFKCDQCNKKFETSHCVRSLLKRKVHFCSNECRHYAIKKNGAIGAKIKQTNLKNHGVEYPMQSEKVKNKRRKANLKKYGVENPMQSEKIQEKSKQTNLRNHGVEYPFQSKEIKNKIKQTNLKNHGVENPMQSEKIRNKQKQTCLENYGVEHPSQSEEIKKKQKQTMLKNHGVEYPSQSKEVKKKQKQTMLKNYGVENPSQSEKIKEKKKQTVLKNHGVEYPSQSKEIQEKQKQTCLENYGVEHYLVSEEFMKRTGGHYETGYINIFGRDIYYRSSYERIYLEYLKRNAKYIKRIETNKSIEYKFKGKKHSYYIDFLVEWKSGKIQLVETKSDYLASLPQTKAKIRAGKRFAKKNECEFVLIDTKEIEKYAA